MAKTTKNGTAAKTALPSEGAVVSALPSSDNAEISGIVLSEDERTQLSRLESEAIRFKIALADADMQFARVEASRNEMREKASKAVQAYVDGVVASAGAHGIDLNDKSVRWNFDTSKMTFTRQN